MGILVRRYRGCEVLKGRDWRVENAALLPDLE